MRFLIQRVTEASVTVEGKVIGEIGKGYLVLVGVCDTDTEAVADAMVKKLAGLRIFEDENGKTNLSIRDVGGSMLVVSQFTLYADCHKGYRPSFIQAAEPGEADRLYRYFTELCRREIDRVETGVFGAHMKVELENDGPFTLVLEDTAQ